IYLGSSHVYSDINPMQLDNINGQYNFDMASASQRLNGSYYLLKEADRYNSLSHVYLDLYYTTSVKDSMSPDLDPINVAQHWNWQNSDYMENSFNKLEYMLSIAGPEKYVEIFLPFSRYRSKLDNWDYINEELEAKKSDAYLLYEDHTDYSDGTYSEYGRQGFYYSTRVIDNRKRMLSKSSGLYDEPMGEKSKEYLCKIIRYCQKRDIPITLFATPVNDFQLVNLGNYDNYINEVKEVADKYGVDFYDFNLAKSEYFSVNIDEHYRDFTHLNAMGAEVFTNFFAKVVSGTSEENQKYFYSSYSEKLQNEPAIVYGLYYKDSIAEEDIQSAEDIEKSIRTLWVASNKEEGMEYRIIMTPEESGQYTVQDFSENKEFAIPLDEHGICTIVARMTDDPEDVQTIEFEY
ncbi:MAG: hypothetical protein K2K46_04225, partial [Lachnospiraceae bacterium]|nr:hypothetical protein [Lachnospiraceae bacterium]